MSDYRGDWPHIRAALDAAGVGFDALEEPRRGEVWNLACAIVDNFAPFHPLCFECRDRLPYWNRAYRCADCRAVFCERCIRPHFGKSQADAITAHGASASSHGGASRVERKAPAVLVGERREPAVEQNRNPKADEESK